MKIKVISRQEAVRDRTAETRERETIGQRIKRINEQRTGEQVIISQAAVTRFPKATEAEIAYLQGLKTFHQTETVRTQEYTQSSAFSQVAPENPNSVNDNVDSVPNLSLLNRNYSSLKRLETLVTHRASSIPEPTGLAFDFVSPLELLLVLDPNLHPHKWQAQMLRMTAGFTNPQEILWQEQPTPEVPLLLCLPAANGSGKDQFLIAAFAVWLAMSGLRNRCIITSASQDQLKHQTEPYIRYLVDRANKKFGSRTFESIHFYHQCLTTGSEIKMFATDDPGLAEGYHPWPGGKMAMIFNEAKSILEDIWAACARCTGYSWWLEISSPSTRTGHFYKSSLNAIHWPQKLELGKYYLRHISAYDCPHIPRSHIDRMKEEMPSGWFSSSVLANFSDIGEQVCVPLESYTACEHVTEIGDDIGIGLDLGGGRDPNVYYVRKGNRIIAHGSFSEYDTEKTPKLLDTALEPWKSGPYKLNADDGGIGHAILDKLRTFGWKIIRRLNNSPAYDDIVYLNLGAEMYFHVRRLVEKRLIKTSAQNLKLKEQLTTRYYVQLPSGKFKLEDKKEARARTGCSPDHADAFVLCFFSYRPNRKPTVVEVKPPGLSEADLLDFGEKLAWGRQNIDRQIDPSVSRRLTLLNGSVV